MMYLFPAVKSSVYIFGELVFTDFRNVFLSDIKVKMYVLKMYFYRKVYTRASVVVFVRHV